MNQNRVISTAVLSLLLGITIPAYAQKGQEEKGGGKGRAQQMQHQQQPQHAQQAQHQQRPQHAKQAQPQRQPQRSQQVQRQQQPQRSRQAQQRGGQQGQRVAYNRGNNGFHGNGNNGNHYGRIPDDRYRAHFGREHSFRMIRPTMISGYNRFQYSGYWFGFNERWPSDWYYTDDVYVMYVGGGYYLYNPRHPGIHITLNLF